MMFTFFCKNHEIAFHLTVRIGC